jgi:hypothetical protein
MVVVAGAALVLTLSSAHAGRYGQQAGRRSGPVVTSSGKAFRTGLGRAAVVALGLCLGACAMTTSRQEIHAQPGVGTTIVSEEFRVGLAPMTTWAVHHGYVPRGHVMTYKDYYRFYPQYRQFLYERSMWGEISILDGWHSHIIIVAPPPRGYYFVPPPPPRHDGRGVRDDRGRPHDGRGAKPYHDPNGRNPDRDRR